MKAWQFNSISLYKVTKLHHLQLLPKKELNFFREISSKRKRIENARAILQPAEPLDVCD